MKFYTLTGDPIEQPEGVGWKSEPINPDFFRPNHPKFDDEQLMRLSALVQGHHRAAQIMREALVSLVYGVNFCLQDVRYLDEENSELFIALLNFDRLRVPWPESILVLAEQSLARSNS